MIPRLQKKLYWHTFVGKIQIKSKNSANLKFIYSEKATKIWQNLQILLEITQQRQKKYVNFVMFCGILRIYELYQNLEEIPR